MDNTEHTKRAMVHQINSNPSERTQLEETYGQVYNTQEVAADFEIIGFMAPFVFVRRKSDNQKGSLIFQHKPRFYHSFKEA